MKTLSDIVVFSDDENLLVLLRGYCFAKKITITALDFSVSGIAALGTYKPGLLLLPISVLARADKPMELAALRRALACPDSPSLCGLASNFGQAVPAEISAWLDVVFQLPIDLCEIDDYINKALFRRPVQVERRGTERRSWQDRRADAQQHWESPVGLQAESEKAAYLAFHLDWCNRCLVVNGKHIELTPKEFELIGLLLSDVDKVFLADEIVKHLWPENHRATKADLYQYMHLLRKKIEDDPNNPKWLKNVKGYGYKLNLC